MWRTSFIFQTEHLLLLTDIWLRKMLNAGGDAGGYGPGGDVFGDECAAAYDGSFADVDTGALWWR